MNQVALFIASFGYVGFFPIAPGTAGSLAALALFAFVRWVGMPAFELGMIVAVLVVGIWSANGAERALGRKDPGPVVIDEVLGMLITLALLPVSLGWRAPRVPAVPVVRRREAVPGRPHGAPARRLRHHAGRRDGRGVFVPRAAPLHVVDAVVAGRVDARPLDAAIIAVGSELLTPEKIDTNSLFITQVLNDLGIAVAFKAIVGDNRAELASHLAHALQRHRVVVFTGGLGPTDDDLTREVVAAHLGLAMREDPAIIEAIERRFASRGWKMPDVNRRQAMVPHGAAVLANPNGTAPGLWIEHDGAVLALLPGPPREMKPMMDGDVRARLAVLAGDTRLFRRLVRVSGKGSPPSKRSFNRSTRAG